MKNRWHSTKRAKYNLGYHLIWCIKYRRKVLLDEIEVSFKKLMFEKAQDICVSIEQLEVMPDHIYIFLLKLFQHMHLTILFNNSRDILLDC